MWKKAKETDLLFGTGMNKASMDEFADVKIREAFERKEVQPFLNFETKE